MAKPNPVLQQIIKSISKKSNDGRVDISWNFINESKKRKIKEASPKDDGDELADLDTELSKPDQKNTPPDEPSEQSPTEPDDGESQSKAPVDAVEDTDEDTVDVEKEKAEKANAELEKAKAETDKAKQEIDKNSYVKLNVPAGLNFLLRKLIDTATKTNTLDALASEFSQKLKITTPEDFQTFSDDMIPYKNIPGMVEFISSIQSMANQEKTTSED